MAITFVGGKELNTLGGNPGSISLTGLSGGTDSAPQIGDVVLIGWGAASAGDVTGSMTATGYTVLDSAFSNSTDDANAVLLGKKLTAADTTATLSNSGADASAANILVYRGVDDAIEDVASTRATGTGSTSADPPSITPATSGAVGVFLGVGACNASFSNFTNLTLNNFQAANENGPKDAIVGMGWLNWSAGALNPAAFGGGAGGTAAARSWAAISIALKPAPNAYSMPAAAGSFTLTGAAANLLKGSKLVADAGSFALNGANVNLLAGFKMPITAGSFALAGADVGLLYGRIMPADAGSFVLAGTDLTFTKGYNFLGGAEAGSFALNGGDVTFRRTYVLAADPQITTIVSETFDANISGWTGSGGTATWEAGRLRQTAGGAFTTTARRTTAIDVIPGRQYVVKASFYPGPGVATSSLRFGSTVGGFDVVAGNWVDGLYHAFTPNVTPIYLSLLANTTAAGQYGEFDNVEVALVNPLFALSGSDVALQYGRIMQAAGAAFTLTGSPANLLKGFRLDAVAGAFTLTGAAAGLLASYLLGASAGTFALAGAAAGLLFGRRLIAEAGAFILAGIDAALSVFRPITPSPSRSSYLIGRLADRLATLPTALRADRVTTLPTDRVVDRSTELTGE